MLTILEERFGTNAVIIKCSEFAETMLATIKLHEIGFKRTGNSERIAAGTKICALGEENLYWAHPYITSGEIHYYHNKFDFYVGDYEVIVTFREFMDLLNDTIDGDIEITDDDFANYLA